MWYPAISVPTRSATVPPRPVCSTPGERVEGRVERPHPRGRFVETFRGGAVLPLWGYWLRFSITSTPRGADSTFREICGGKWIVAELRITERTLALVGRVSGKGEPLDERVNSLPDSSRHDSPTICAVCHGHGPGVQVIEPSRDSPVASERWVPGSIGVVSGLARVRGVAHVRWSVLEPMPANGRRNQ